MTPADVPNPWLRGALDLCLLTLLYDGEAYGYELAARLAGAGVGEVQGGSLYPAPRPQVLRAHRVRAGRADGAGHVVAALHRGGGRPPRRGGAGMRSVLDVDRRSGGRPG